eukprot:jgi/Astpho2/9098/fgenesh1_pg.00133_%23_93_t
MQLSEYDQGEAYLQGTNVVSVSLLEELRDAADATLTAANVVSLVEVTRKLASRPLEVQGASQIAQRLNQLWPYQRSRESCDKQQLGYVPPAVPAPVMLSPPSERLATFLARLTIEHGSSNMSAAIVWRCTTIGSAGSSIVLKSSREVNIEAATGLKGLHNNGYLHGDISPYNIAVCLAEDGTTATTLIDLATLRPLRDPKMPVHLVTGTPDFMAVEVLEGAAQAASSDLESLMYCFLHVATQGRLPWKDLPRHTRAPAIYAKYSCMAKKSLYHSKITAHIREPSLVPIAKSLRGLFFRDDKYEPMLLRASQHITVTKVWPAMVTVQELIARIQLPEGARERLHQVVQRVGYGDDDDVDDGMTALTATDVMKAAGLEGLEPLLTYVEMWTLLLKIQLAVTKLHGMLHGVLSFAGR